MTDRPNEQLHPLGQTRTRVAADHAVIGPDSHVLAPLPNWTDTQGVVLISPAMGAAPRGPRFMQYLAYVEAGSRTRWAGPGVQRFVYVLEGSISLDDQTLTGDDYAWLPPGTPHDLRSDGPGKLLVFEKLYVEHADASLPDAVFGRATDAVAEPFMGDTNAMLAPLLPGDLGFDLAINRFTFQPGTALPLVETHVNEHGLYLQHGAGIYRLGSDTTETWTPIAAGDSIWMAAFCPQWFVAMGTEPATYLYSKDVNRDWLAHGS